MTNETKEIKPFYIKAKKQYQDSEKPFIFEFNIKSTQPKIKKLSIIINKFVEIFKEGLKPQYLKRFSTAQSDYCWQMFDKQYQKTYQMDFIKKTIYDKQRLKLLQFFGIKMHTKTIFKFLQQAVDDFSQLFIDPNNKKITMKQQLKILDFLRDGRYKIEGQIITKYQQYEEKKKEKQKMQEKKQKEKQQKQRRQKQNQMLLLAIQQKKKQQERQRKLKEQETKKKIQEQFKKKQEVIHAQVDFKPDQYIRTRQTKIQKDGAIQKEQTLNGKQGNKQFQFNPLNRQKHKKNSAILFQQRYEPDMQAFSFKDKPQVSTNKETCFQCKKALSPGLYIIGGNQNFCFYTGNWYCNQHINQQRISIPWKALQSFDLRGYQVSKKSFNQIKYYYDKPIIKIQNDSIIVKNNPKLYDFFVVKRQIHLIYDAICNVQFIDMLLKKKLNYCLKINLFSLKNLYDIYNGQQIVYLNQQYELYTKHFYKCDTCQKKRGYICPKCKDPVKIFPFEIKQTFGCKTCKSLYHKKCSPCDCTRDQ